MNNSFVFDTYALIEIIRGNKNYLRYINSKIVITEFILAELCFNLLKEYSPEISYSYVDKFANSVVKVDKEIIKQSMYYRLKNLKSKISITDCIGYYLAKDLGINFLTGDKEFKDMPNVEFVR